MQSQLPYYGFRQLVGLSETEVSSNDLPKFSSVTDLAVGVYEDRCEKIHFAVVYNWSMKSSAIESRDIEFSNPLGKYKEIP